MCSRWLAAIRCTERHTENMTNVQQNLGWDGVSEVYEDDPTPEEKRRISQLLDSSTTRTGDVVDPAVFFAHVEDI